jgi:hypothetical protein
VVAHACFLPLPNTGKPSALRIPLTLDLWESSICCMLELFFVLNRPKVLFVSLSVYLLNSGKDEELGFLATWLGYS